MPFDGCSYIDAEPDEGRLAGAVGTEDQPSLVGLDRPADVVEDAAIVADERRRVRVAATAFIEPYSDSARARANCHESQVIWCNQNSPTGSLGAGHAQCFGLPSRTCVAVGRDAGRDGRSVAVRDDGTDPALPRTPPRRSRNARDAANAAADALVWRRRTKLDLLTDEKNRLDAEIAELEKQVAELQQDGRDRRRQSLHRVGQHGHRHLLNGNDRPHRASPDGGARRHHQRGVGRPPSTTTTACSTSSTENVPRSNEARPTTGRPQQETTRPKQQQANDEVARLKVVEKDRLNDEAVQRALEAQRQKDAEAAAEGGRRAAARIRPRPRRSWPRPPPTTWPRSWPRRAAAPTVATKARARIDRSTRSESSSAGGTTGGGGIGGRPVTVLPAASTARARHGSARCTAGLAFGDTWGAARSGGRTHQGVDMISPRGTPIFAVVDGVADPEEQHARRQDRRLTGADGNQYYYAHLDGWANLGPVVKGTVIGIRRRHRQRQVLDTPSPLRDPSRTAARRSTRTRRSLANC